MQHIQLSCDSVTLRNGNHVHMQTCVCMALLVLVFGSRVAEPAVSPILPEPVSSLCTAYKSLTGHICAKRTGDHVWHRFLLDCTLLSISF